MTYTVVRLEIPNSIFEFEGENNAYLVRTNSGTILIDTGVDTPETRNHLLKAIGRVGVAVADIGAIYLTHWHPDHAGLAGYVQEISGAPVYVHERDAALVRGDADAIEHLTTRYMSLFEEWDVPEEKQHEVADLWGWDRGASAQEAAFAAHDAGTAPMSRLHRQRSALTRRYCARCSVPTGPHGWTIWIRKTQGEYPRL